MATPTHSSRPQWPVTSVAIPRSSEAGSNRRPSCRCRNGFCSTIIDACRTNILPLFEAVACENPYPAQHFPERNFNQLVLKALFNGVALSRVVGLASRLNADLTRMAGDYADERRAAGRAVPADIGLAMQNRSN